MHIYAHGSIFIEFHVQMCKYVQMCMCNVMCTHAHRMGFSDQNIYIAFINFSPGPKFGHFWRFSEYFLAENYSENLKK